jgi:Cu-Zn family superoxide dismutase
MSRRRTAGSIGAATLAVAATVALAPAAEAAPARVVQAAGPLAAFADPYGDGRPNPTAGGSARVRSVAAGSRTVVLLQVGGLQPDRAYGAHVHVGACSVNKAGGHYQHVPGVVTRDNEVWLDFTTDGSGRAVAHAVTGWAFRPDGANAVVVHDRQTHDDGTAGAKLGCLDVDF